MPAARVAPAQQIHHLPAAGLLSVVFLHFCGGHMAIAIQQQDEIQVSLAQDGQIVITQEPSDLQSASSNVFVAVTNVDALIRAIRAAKRQALEGRE
ncbi:hypothetical protein GCM10027195_44740 [Comamonas sediminis]